MKDWLSNYIVHYRSRKINLSAPRRYKTEYYSSCASIQKQREKKNIKLEWFITINGNWKFKHFRYFYFSHSQSDKVATVHRQPSWKMYNIVNTTATKLVSSCVPTHLILLSEVF